jgi:DNA mismatch repair protein PMS2
VRTVLLIHVLLTFSSPFFPLFYHSFETLQRTSKLQSQPLLIPLAIQTTAANEQVIADNLSIFEENGFRIKVDEDCSPYTQVGDDMEENSHRKLKLMSIPIYKGIEFGINDVNELASLILDDGYSDEMMENRNGKNYLSLKNANLRESKTEDQKKRFLLPKLMSTFASKACRQAVMIGMPLDPKQMEKIVSQLSSIDQPWNCPHGRPTLRHLLDLKELSCLK